MKNSQKRSKDSAFVRYCLELLTPIDNTITARAMFGGHGLYRDGAIFGLIADDRLYFKVDEHSLSLYEEHNAEPFTYEKNGKRYQMSYYEVPIFVLGSHNELTRFVDEACAAKARSKDH